MKKIFSFTKKKKHTSGTPDSGSVLSLGYELKEKDLGKIHKAASVGDLAKLKQLAKKNDINQRDKENRTALHIACASGHAEIVQFLVECKAELNLYDNQNRSALMKGVQGQHERCVSILLENHAAPNLTDINGNTALHLAANIPSISTAFLLLGHGAEINAQNKEGFSPLIVAVREDHIDMAEFLLQEGANVDCMDQDQKSPLMIAAGSGQIGMLRLLLKFDADITLKDTSGRSADDYAVMNGHHPCSLLIIEHGTQRKDGPSLSHQGPSKNKKKMLLGSPSQDSEVGFSLGGPATEKDADFEENSQSDSLSRVSKSAVDEWPSSENDDFIEKNPQKVNLRKMIASKKGEASALPDRSLNALHHPVDPRPSSFVSTPSQMTSTPLLSYEKKEDSTEDEPDDDKKEVRDEEEEGDISEENDELEESGDSLDAMSPARETAVPKDKKRDFLSELGLEKEEEQQDSWESESQSESPKMPHEDKQSFQSQNLEEMSNVEEEIKENLFYIPSFLRGKEGNRMAFLEPRRSLGRPRCSKGEVVNKGNDDKADTVQKETEKAKWEPLSVLSKLEGDNDPKADLMEELGLGDVDDLEDASDWDSASTTSKRILPGRRMSSPQLEEFPEISSPSVKEQDKDAAPAAHLTPQTLSSTPSHLGSHPQPRVRKLLLHKPESEKESDWEPDSLTSSGNTVKTDSLPQFQAVVKPVSPELSSMSRDTKSNIESDEQQQKEKYDPVDTCESDLNAYLNPFSSHCVDSDNGEKDIDLRDQCSPEERGEASDDVPWEKRYEKLWVEVEKREVKSTFKNVAGELKEKFGELSKSRHPAEDIIEEKQATVEHTSTEEQSSDEDEGEIIVRPTARARSIVLNTIPEQRESGLEDSVTESTDSSLCEDGNQASDPAGSESNIHQEPDLYTDDGLVDSSSPSPQLATAKRESKMDDASTGFTDGHTVPVSDVDHSPFLKGDTKHGPIHKQVVQQMDLILKDTIAELDEAEKNNASSEEDPEEFAKSHPTSLIGCSASVAGVSDEELEEDMERFKLEVGKGMTKTVIEVQKSSASWDTGGTLRGELGTEIPETRSGRLSSQVRAVHQEEQPTATKSTNAALLQLHLPLQQTYNSNKQEKKAAEETLQLELVRGAQHSRAPQTKTHSNGDPLSVFDDSSLSEVSDNEGRLASRGQQKNENPEEVDMAEDFDELTQSSDTATDDTDSPTSGYRHVSTLIQKLDSATLDSRSMVKLQNIFHEYERTIQKEKSRHGYLADKLELQTEVTNLKFQLKQEQENRCNATMMYNTTKDKLRRTEELHQVEVQERQKVELTLRNLELEMRTVVNNMKLLEEDHSETQRLLAQERSARTLQENLFNSHLRKQQEIEEENKRNVI
uniref:CCDC144C-like coiled-coil domain-containing protein n=1 Tax=Monopterus albus TaxID=43700 RepID=A0A3Q3JZ13_MONAL